jgi:hypothetical protein
VNLLETTVTTIASIFVYIWLLGWILKIDRIVELLARIASSQ